MIRKKLYTFYIGGLGEGKRILLYKGKMLCHIDLFNVYTHDKRYEEVIEINLSDRKW